MVSWTRQHFELIAETVDEEIEDVDTKLSLCSSFAKRLEEKNPRFDSGKFIRACGGVVKEYREF